MQNGAKLADSAERIEPAGDSIRGPLRTAFGIAELAFAKPPSKEELLKRLNDPNEFVRRHARLLLRKLARNGRLDSSYPIRFRSGLFDPTSR